MKKRENINRRRADSISLKLRWQHKRFISALKAETIAQILRTYSPDGEPIEYETLAELYRKYSERAEG